MPRHGGGVLVNVGSPYSVIAALAFSGGLAVAGVGAAFMHLGYEAGATVVFSGIAVAAVSLLLIMVFAYKGELS